MILRSGTGVCMAIAFCWVVGMTQKAPESRPIAKGEYSLEEPVQKAGSGLVLDHWLMYRLPDGSFKVDVEIKTVPAPAKAEEHLTFTKDMKLVRYEWTKQTENKTEPGSIRCDFTDSEARCEGKTLNGRAFSTNLAVKSPYAFVPVTDEADFDSMWSFQSLARQAKRSASGSTSVDMITFVDNDAGYGTVLAKGPHPFGSFRYVGRDWIEIAGKKVNAHKFQVTGKDPHTDKDPDKGALYFWLSESGLLLKVTAPGMHLSTIFVLSRYEGPAL